MTLFDRKFATYAVLPSGVIAIPAGLSPTTIGVPAVWVVRSIGVTVAPRELVAYANTSADANPGTAASTLTAATSVTPNRQAARRASAERNRPPISIPSPSSRIEVPPPGIDTCPADLISTTPHRSSRRTTDTERASMSSRAGHRGQSATASGVRSLSTPLRFTGVMPVWMRRNRVPIRTATRCVFCRTGAGGFSVRIRDGARSQSLVRSSDSPRARGRGLDRREYGRVGGRAGRPADRAAGRLERLGLFRDVCRSVVQRLHGHLRQPGTKRHRRESEGSRPNTQYGTSGALINPVYETKSPQDRCHPITGWDFALGTGIRTRADTGVWGSISRVTGPYSTSIVTQASTPLLDVHADPVPGVAPGGGDDD